MKNTYNLLHICFWLPIVATVIIAFLGEAEIMDITATSDDAGVREYWTTTTMELITVVLLVIGAAIFKIGAVKRHIARRGYEAHALWTLIRIVLIGIPLVVNIVFYYIYVNVSFGYMAIICAIFMAFAKPEKVTKNEE